MTNGNPCGMPSKAFRLPQGEKLWGLFMPLYALHSSRSWGIGDFTDLKNMIDWTADCGGRIVAILPLLATEISPDITPCPYQPSSRLFWSELYLDIEALPEFNQSSQAQSLFQSDSFQSVLKRVRGSKLVNYHTVARLKHEILKICSRQILSIDSDRRRAFEQFRATRAGVTEYARHRGAEWHEYAQFVAEEEFTALKERSQDRGVYLYLDLPLGVDPFGYDAKRYRGLFVEDYSVGAPPDDFFACGQNWNFRPLNPKTIAGKGSAYFADGIRNHVRHAGILRIDHVMGLNRLFWIPRGEGGDIGAYVSYPHDELYEILCRESQQSQTVLIGEDLGIVPPEVRQIMVEHGLYRTFVLRNNLSELPEDCVVCLGTHDMPMFAGRWTGEGSPRDGLIRELEMISSSPSAMVLVNLEDLWLETEPQNVPGTVSSIEHPNWRRKSKLSIEQFSSDPSVLEILRRVNERRSLQE